MMVRCASGVFKQLSKLTYALETDEEDGIGKSDDESIQIINLVHVLSGDDKEDGIG